jgi:hypothetical protein
LTNVTVNNTSPLLSIQLEHALAKVRVVVDCSYNEWTITSIANTLTLGSVANSGTVGLVSGTASGTTGNRTITWTGGLSDPSKPESDSILVIPQSGTLTVSIPAGAVVRQTPLSAIPAAATTGTFSATLAAGSSYKLHVKFRAPIPAWSNIYWDENASKLTFVPASKDGSTDHSKEGYNGVFFAWGSLIGCHVISWYSFGMRAYIPNGSGWVVDDNTYEEVSDLPCWRNAYGNVIDNTHTDAFLGDICQYLGTDPKLSGYRLPKPEELLLHTGSGEWALDGWTMHGNSTNTGNIQTDPGLNAGTADFISDGGPYAENMALGGIRLVAGGFFGDYIGSKGFYWTSESSGINDAVYVGISNNVRVERGFRNRPVAGPVRCIKN